MCDAQGMLPVHVALCMKAAEEVVVKVLEANMQVGDGVRGRERRVREFRARIIGLRNIGRIRDIGLVLALG